ncbi:MAG: biotin--[acetyl-CoA-carboxylase] ligase [Actinomycetota bacterium]
MTDRSREARQALSDVADGLARDGRWAPWADPVVLPTTESTMADAAQLATSGSPEGTVIVAEEQTAGRGRAGRQWDSPAHAGIWLTILLRPGLDPQFLGWLPLVTGTAVVTAVRATTRCDVRLKWPNDLVVESRDGLGPVGGILAERLGDGSVLVGIGLNVDQAADELPPGGTSLRLLGAVDSRERILVSVLGEFAVTYRQWIAGADPAPDYLDLCVTVGSDVRVEAPGVAIEGRATGVGPHGELLVTDGSGTDHKISAGDVLLVRPAFR